MRFVGPGPRGNVIVGRGDHEAALILGIVLHFIVAVLAIAAIVVLVRYVAARPWRGGRPGAHRSAAIEELDLRYARGEIDRADYLTRRADLSVVHPAGPPRNTAPPPPPPA